VAKKLYDIVPVADPLCLLEGAGLRCIRGDTLVFDGLDFSVNSGQCLHVRGANGSGKTSLLRILAGLASPAQGVLLWNARPLRGHESVYRRQLVYHGHQPALKDDLSAAENLTIAAHLAGFCAKPPQIAHALESFGLKTKAQFPVRYLSAGQKRRVSLARLALGHDSTVWVLDEPFNALDQGAIHQLHQLINGHLSRGGLAILTSHQDIAVDSAQVLSL
jgi:heme exporter protein A